MQINYYQEKVNQIENQSNALKVNETYISLNDKQATDTGSYNYASNILVGGSKNQSHIGMPNSNLQNYINNHPSKNSIAYDVKTRATPMGHSPDNVVNLNVGP
jgi:hypothetical protein